MYGGTRKYTHEKLMPESKSKRFCLQYGDYYSLCTTIEKINY